MDPGFIRRLLFLAILVALLAAVLGGVAVSLTDRLVFMPSKYPEGNWAPPRAPSVPIVDVHFSAADGTALNAWYGRPEGARATFLVLHGNAGNLTHRAHLMEALIGLPAAVFLLDYRGYGRSAGQPTEAGVYQDAQAALLWLAAHGVPSDRVVLYGESLGGAVAIETAQRTKVLGLVVQSSFTSMPDMARRLTGLPLGFLLKTRMNSLGKVGGLTVPKLFFHGEADELVPVSMGRKLYEVAAEPKRFVTYPGVGHNDWPGPYARQWLSETARFLAALPD